MSEQCLTLSSTHCIGECFQTATNMGKNNQTLSIKETVVKTQTYSWENHDVVRFTLTTCDQERDHRIIWFPEPVRGSTCNTLWRRPTDQRCVKPSTHCRDEQNRHRSFELATLAPQRHSLFTHIINKSLLWRVRKTIHINITEQLKLQKDNMSLSFLRLRCLWVTLLLLLLLLLM